MKERSGLLAALAAILTSILISTVIHWGGSSPNIYSDITGSFWGRCWVQSRILPYVGNLSGCDPSFEYPVLSGLILYFDRLAGPTIDAFYFVFSAMVALASVVVGWAAWKIARSGGKELNPLFFLLPSIIIYGVYNFDMFHAAFVLLSILSFIQRRPWMSALFLGLAVDTKLTSVVLLPVLVIELKKVPGDSWLKRNSGRLKYLGVFGSVLAFFNVPVAVLNLQSFLSGYQFIGNYGLEDAWYVWIFQSPSTWFYAKLFGFGVSGLLLLRVYTLKVDLLTKSFLALGAYLLGTYIYSPQFDILVIPLVAVLDFRHPLVFPWDGFDALIILTWFIGSGTPDWAPTLPWTVPQTFALLRSGCLAGMLVAVTSRAGIPFAAWLGGESRPRLRGPPVSSPP